MPFLTRVRILRLMILTGALTFVYWLLIQPDVDGESSQDSVAADAGYTIGSQIATPLVLALITVGVVALIWRWRVRRST
jgi:hypothetical protein